MFKGTMTALVTPFKDGHVDTRAFEQLIERQVGAGLEGIVPVGTTGESPTLNTEEHLRVIELGVQFARKRTKVIAGTGSNSTPEAIELTQGAEKAKADAALIVAPYYNKPSQEGLYQHFSAIARGTDLPIILYSIPGRCGIEIAVDTVARLAADHKNIVGLKESSGSIDRISLLKRAVPESFSLISGDDFITVPFISVGAVGVISVASNVIPGRVKKMVDAALAGDFVSAQKQHLELYPLFRDLFIEANPAPAKAAMFRQGWMSDEVRLPLVKMSESGREKLFATLDHLGIK